MIRTVILFLVMAPFAARAAQQFRSDVARLAEAQKAFDAGRWEDAARIARGPADQTADLDFLAGLALAKLQRWDESRAAFEDGRAKAPRESRFPVELAGVSYKQHDRQAAKRELMAALRLEGRDAYAREFLGTIYFLEGNLEAALKYWNPADQPRLRKVSVVPPPRVDETLLARAIGFNAPQILTTDALLGAEARIDNLGIYPYRRIELTPAGNESYDATLHLAERHGWGDSRLEGALSVLSGLPYATVYPSVYDLGGGAVNLTALLRWDSEKRRAHVSISAPLWHDPRLRGQFYFDARNENWNLTGTFFGSGAALSDLHVRRVAVGGQFREVVNGRWSWSTGFELANRSFQNLQGHTEAPEKPFFTDGTSFGYWLKAERALIRVPEHRFVAESSAELRAGKEFATGGGSFGTIRGSLKANWLPLAQGDDYQMQVQLRAGATLGPVPFDELFQLGIERDNDLWLRGHAGTSAGRKGAGPLGRRFLLANWEMDKNIYGNGFVTVKLGPFLDNGAIADSTGLFGSRKWLWDTGAQCKVQVLGSLTVVLSYGRDLRGGRNALYGTVLH